MNEAVQIAVGILTLLALIIAGITGAVKFILLPYLDKHFHQPAQAIVRVEQAVTANGHKSDEPSIRDLLYDIKTDVRETREEAQEARGEAREAKHEVVVLATMFDGHLEWSQTTVDELAAEIREAKAIAERRDK